MKYNQAKCAAEYLGCVLSTWKRFKKANGGLCRAIKDILVENERLKTEIEELKGKKV